MAFTIWLIPAASPREAAGSKTTRLTGFGMWEQPFHVKIGAIVAHDPVRLQAKCTHLSSGQRGGIPVELKVKLAIVV
jgi:hypothetical protein